MTPIMMNMTEAGELCGVSRYTIQDWIRQGLPYIPTGKKHKRILVAVLEKWLEGRQVKLGRKS